MKTLALKNPNGSTKTYYGEEAEILTDAEQARFEANMKKLRGNMASIQVAPPHTKKFIPPKPKLKAGIIYSGDNGQLICVNCAGASAKYSGYDLSGHKVTPMPADAEMLREWKAQFGKDFACEGGCTKYPTP